MPKQLLIGHWTVDYKERRDKQIYPSFKRTIDGLVRYIKRY
jgi:hypothetical protein